MRREPPAHAPAGRAPGVLACAFHAKAWVAWLTATSAVVLMLPSPAVTLVALAVLGVVSAACASEADALARTMLRIAVVVTLVRTILFALTGHTGDTILLTLPALRLPAVLGGTVLGGAVTAEVVAESLAEGVRIVAILVAFGVFLGAVRTARLLRLLPPALFEAALVVTIALAFVPSMLRHARDVADAQRLRGHRFRGPRSLLPLVAPVVAGGLERSLALASSMEARGYGRRMPAAAGIERRARVLALGALLAFVAGLAVRTAGARPLAWLLVVAGVGCFGASMRALGRTSPRTRLRDERVERHDRALIACSALTVVLASLARDLPGVHWSAYPVLTLPSLDVRVVALPLLLLAPVAIAAVREARLRAASSANVDAAIAGEVA